MCQKRKSRTSLFGFVIYLQTCEEERERLWGQHFSASHLNIWAEPNMRFDELRSPVSSLDNILPIYPGNVGEIETLTFAVWTWESLLVAGGRWITDWLNKIENFARSSHQPWLLLERNKSKISNCEFEFIEAVNLTSHITLTHRLNSQQKINFNSNFSDISPLTSHTVLNIIYLCIIQCEKLNQLSSSEILF